MIETWEIIIFLSYGIPLLGLSLFVWYHLMFNKVFKGPFFSIASVIATVDLMCYITFWFMLRFPLWPATGFIYAQYLPITFSVLITFLSYYLPKVRDLLVLATALNRLTTLALPYSHKQFWDRWLWTLILASWMLPLIVTGQNIFGRGAVLPFSLVDNGSYAIGVETSWYPISNALTSALFTSITSILSFTLNLITLYRLYARKQTWKSPVITINPFQVALNKSEINLLFISFWDFISDLMFTIHQVIIYTFVLRNVYYDPLFDALYLSLPWIVDITCLSRPIILIVMCKQMRIVLAKAIIKRRCCRRKLQISNAAAVIPPPVSIIH